MVIKSWTSSEQQLQKKQHFGQETDSNGKSHLGEGRGAKSSAFHGKFCPLGAEKAKEKRREGDGEAAATKPGQKKKTMTGGVYRQEVEVPRAWRGRN